MTPEALLEAFLELAHTLGLEIRSIGGGPVPGSDGPPTSGVCRVKGRVWVVLTTADPLAQQIDAVGRGLLAHDRAALEDRFLPPAVRTRLSEIEEAGNG